jgi:hypothetical protein
MPAVICKSYIYNNNSRPLQWSIPELAYYCNLRWPSPNSVASLPKPPSPHPSRHASPRHAFIADPSSSLRMTNERRRRRTCLERLLRICRSLFSPACCSRHDRQIVFLIQHRSMRRDKIDSGWPWRWTAIRSRYLATGGFAQRVFETTCFVRIPGHRPTLNPPSG